MYMEIFSASIILYLAKKATGKSKEELQMEKRQHLEQRLDAVQSQLSKGGQPKKTQKKGLSYNVL